MKTRSRLKRAKPPKHAKRVGVTAPSQKETLTLLGTLATLALIYAVDLTQGAFALVYWQTWLARAFALGLMLTGFSAYLWVRRPRLLQRDLNTWFLAALLVFNALVVQLLGSISPFSPYLIPISLSVGLVVMFFGSEAGLVFSLMFSGLIALGTWETPSADVALVLFAGAMVMVMRARRLERQRELILIGLEVGLVNIAALFTLTLSSHAPSWNWLQFAVAGINGPINALLLMGLVPLAEYVLQRTSPLGLIELLNTSHPLLERLAGAPGTYQHSLSVSRLASEAARRIGADALLTQVGGLYHDIGKVAEGVQSTYFAENQRDGYNPHDDLPPNISRIILQNHVKAGLEMGQESGLKDDILQFIAQHHGTTVMRFFYLKALRDPESNASLSLEDYRYEGPKPQTKETAILMISDAAESASRSAESLEQLEVTIDRIVKEWLEDGQFNECPLTMADLAHIKASLKDTLRSMVHTRPGNYPSAKALTVKPSKAKLKPTQQTPASDGLEQETSA